MLDALAAMLNLGPAPWWLRFAAGVIAWDAALGAFLIAAAWRAGAPSARCGTMRTPPAVSVLVAARDAEGAILNCLRSVFEQRGVEFEVIVAECGSLDRTAHAVSRAYGLLPDQEDPSVWASPEDLPITLIRVAAAGKGAALNAAMRRARHPVVVTVGASARLEAGALARVAMAFRDPVVEVVAGGLRAGNRTRFNWLVGQQRAEYLRENVWRAGWGAVGLLGEAPAAFSGFRAAAVRHAGGFSEGADVSDHEIVLRLRERALLEGRETRVEAAPEAVAQTAAPQTVLGFARQRRRRLEGLASALWRCRRLMLDGRAGAFGMVRMPLLAVELAGPLAGSVAWAAILATWVGATVETQLAALGLGISKFVWDGIYCVAVMRLSRPRGKRRGHGWATWACGLAEPLVFAWFRNLAALGPPPPRWRPPRPARG